MKHGKFVGKHCMGNKKISTHTQDLSMVMSIYERESESTYPCRSLSRSVKKRDWCSRTSPRSKSQVVPRSDHELVPNGRHLRVQHTYGLMTPSPPRSSERWWSSRWVPAARRRGDGGEEQSLQGFAKHYEDYDGGTKGLGLPAHGLGKSWCVPYASPAPLFICWALGSKLGVKAFSRSVWPAQGRFGPQGKSPTRIPAVPRTSGSTAYAVVLPYQR